METKKLLILLGLALALQACAIPNLTETQPPERPSEPPPQPTRIPSTPLPVPLPTDFTSPTLPTYSPDDLTAHYQAMRPGFESDVDAFADGTRYWMDLNLALDPVRIEGLERVRVVNQETDTLDELVFRLYPNHMVERTVLTVTDITMDGAAVEGVLEAEDTVLRVPLPDALAPGDAVEVEMTFSLHLSQGDNLAGFGVDNNPGDTEALPSFFPMLSVYEDGAWWETELDTMADPVYSETALFDVWVNAPRDLVIAASGVAASVETEGDITRYHFATGPVRDFALGVNRDFETLSGEVDGVTVTVWSLPGSAEADSFILTVTEQAVRAFSDEFGPYPFTELDVVEITTGASGIEYPGLFYLCTQRAWTADDTYTEWVTAHETGHQWWYSLVGNDQVGEPWIDEGLTEYSSEIYFLHTQGNEGAAMAHAYFVDDVGSFVDDYGEQLPIGMAANEYPDEDAYDVMVYSAGALFYDELVEAYGRDAVREMLRIYFEDYRYGVAHNDDLETLITEELGEEADDIFAEWVYGEEP